MSSQNQKNAQEVRKPCIFCAIVEGVAPAHRVCEDQENIAILSKSGDVLAIPKAHVREIEDLPESQYVSLMMFKRRISTAIKPLYPEKRICKFETGFSVQHAHVHIAAMSSREDIARKYGTTKDELPENILSALAIELSKQMHSDNSEGAYQLESRDAAVGDCLAGYAHVREAAPKSDSPAREGDGGVDYGARLADYKQKHYPV